MGADDDLRINTLHRFAKHSEDLILEEYSHCEIPAGCGGVVLRWYDPAIGHPVKVMITTHGTSRSEVWLDGSKLMSSRTQLAPGAHVIAVQLERSGGGMVPFSLGVMFDADEYADIISAGAPRWRIATAAPAAGWEGSHDDTGWTAPAVVSPDTVPKDRRYPFERAAERGQPIFGLPADAAWVRVRFTSGAPR